MVVVSHLGETPCRAKVALAVVSHREESNQAVRHPGLSDRHADACVDGHILRPLWPGRVSRPQSWR